MKQWYCVIGQQRYGPISEEVLRQWAAEGRLHGFDLVWCEGMTQWASAGATFPDLFPGQAWTVGPLPTPNAPQATGGQTPNCEITRKARSILKGGWGNPILVSLVLVVLGVLASFIPDAFHKGAGTVVSWLVAGPLELGSAIFFLTFVRRGDAEVGLAFAGFKNFAKSLGLYLLRNLFVLLWMLLLIIPGIIAGLAYSQAFYILADNPGIGVVEAIRRSKEMMHGHKWKLFCLQWRFVGWYFLCILTLGIGFLWLVPYVVSSMAVFYHDIQPAAAVAVEPA